VADIQDWAREVITRPEERAAESITKKDVSDAASSSCGAAYPSVSVQTAGT